LITLMSPPTTQHPRPRPPRPGARDLYILLAAGLVVLFLAACRSAPKAPIVPEDSPLTVIPARRIVAPVSDLGEVGLALERALKVNDARFDDGRASDAALYRVTIEQTAPAAGLPAWLRAPARWSFAPADPRERRKPSDPPSTLALVFTAPEDAVGQGLWIGGKRLSLSWLPRPASMARELPASAWAPVIPERFRRSSTLLTLLAPEARSPLYRWRFRLLVEGLQPPAPGDPSGLRFDDDVAEALATLTEDRWRVALGRLIDADPLTADRLRWRIAAMVDTGLEVFPAWPTSDAELSALLTDLLRPGLSASQVIYRAEGWINSQPSAIVWTLDDAAGREARTQRPLCTLGIANLTPVAQLAWAEDGRAAAPDLVKVDAWGVAEITAAVPLRSGFNDALPETPKPVKIGVRAGDWRTSATTLPGTLDVRPPGLSIGPLFSEWSMDEWLRGSDTAAPCAPGTTALLQFRGSLTPSASTRRGWTLLLECRTAPEPRARDQSSRVDADKPVDAPAPGVDRVRLWFGPRLATRAIISVDSRGGITSEPLPTPLAPVPDPPRVPAPPGVSHRGEGRWMCELEIPPDCLEADGTLLLAIERFDGSAEAPAEASSASWRGTAVRSSWPRPMLPWQREPGRAAIDLSAWSGRPKEAGSPLSDRLRHDAATFGHEGARPK
jgi:hypothetical protein